MEPQPRLKSPEPAASVSISKAFTLSDQDSKAIAAWHVEKFYSEIENLNQAYAAHTARVTSLSQELLNCSNKHIELNAAKDAEIAQALKEIETRYDSLQANVRRHEKWLENAKAKEIMTTRRNHKGEREEAGQASRSEVVVFNASSF
jgi:hypothetical protein